MQLNRALAIVFAAIVAVAAPASAVPTGGGIDTVNNTDNRIWVTIYDLAKTTHIDYGWVEPHTDRLWTHCCYAAGSYYHVRAEVKKIGDNRSDPETIYDTSIQITPQLCAEGANTYGRSDIVLEKGKDNYYWEYDAHPYGLRCQGNR